MKVLSNTFGLLKFEFRPPCRKCSGKEFRSKPLDKVVGGTILSEAIRSSRQML